MYKRKRRRRRSSMSQFLQSYYKIGRLACDANSLVKGRYFNRVGRNWTLGQFSGKILNKFR